MCQFAGLLSCSIEVTGPPFLTACDAWNVILWQDYWWLLALSLGAMVAESGCQAVGAVVGISQGAGMQLHACGVLTQRVHPANPSTNQSLFVWSVRFTDRV
jgi:hypothetical protein